MEDQNFSDKTQVKINILKFLKENHSPFLDSAVLDQHHFNHYSVIDVTKNYKFSIFRHLSTLGRKYIKDYKFTVPGRVDNLLSNEINFKMDRLVF